MNTKCRIAGPEDFASMRELLLTHGPNDWNYLTEESVAREFDDLAAGHAHAIVAEADGRIVGFAVLNPESSRFAENATPGTQPEEIAYIGNVVTDQALAGRGIGTQLLREAVKLATVIGAREVFIERHEENPGSAGMMRKAGFEIVRVFDDHRRRWSGSRRTALCRYRIA